MCVLICASGKIAHLVRLESCRPWGTPIDVGDPKPPDEYCPNRLVVPVGDGVTAELWLGRTCGTTVCGAAGCEDSGMVGEDLYGTGLVDLR